MPQCEAMLGAKWVRSCLAVGCRWGHAKCVALGERGTWALMKSTGEDENARKKERRRAASRARATSAASRWSICRASLDSSVSQSRVTQLRVKC